MSTPTAHLRAALEKHRVLYSEQGTDSENSEIWHINDSFMRTEPAILEAMQQHRAEALEEVDRALLAQGEVMNYHEALKAKLAALKTSPGGSLRESEG